MVRCQDVETIRFACRAVGQHGKIASQQLLLVAIAHANGARHAIQLRVCLLGEELLFKRLILRD